MEAVNPIVIAVIAFVGVLGIWGTISALTNRQADAVRRRLDHHAVQVKVTEAKRLDRVNILKERTYSNVAPVNVLLSRFKPARTAAVELTHANMKITVAQYLAFRFALAAACFVALRVAFGSPIFGLAAALVAVMAPRVLVWLRIRRRLTAFEAQLAEAIDLLVGAMRSGYGFLQGIESVAKEMGDPMREELHRVVEQINVGISPADALQELTERIESYDLRLFAAAVTVQRSSGGNLAEVLENLANTVRERRRIRGEVSAITTGPRVSSYVLGLLPIGLLLFFVATNAPYRAVMVESMFGRMMVGGATVWSLIGFFFAQKMAKVEY